MGMMDAIGGDAYAPREVATRNGRRPAVLCDAAALLMELVEAEMRRLPPGPRITLVRKLAALGSRELDETRRNATPSTSVPRCTRIPMPGYRATYRACTTSDDNRQPRTAGRRRPDPSWRTWRPSPDERVCRDRGYRVGPLSNRSSPTYLGRGVCTVHLGRGAVANRGAYGERLLFRRFWSAETGTVGNLGSDR